MSIKSLFILMLCLSLFFILQAVYWIHQYQLNKKKVLLSSRLGEIDDDNDDLLFREEVEGDWAQKISNLLRSAGEDADINAFLQKLGIYATASFLLSIIFIKSLFTSVIIAIITVYFAYLQLISKREKRIDQLEQQLPEALEMMIISLRAGQSLEQTFALNAKELPAPIGEEFKQISEEVRLGLSMEDSLKGLTSRLVGAKTVRSFVVSVLVLRQTGGNLIEVLEAIIDTMRQQSQYEHKLKSMTAESRSNARTLGALPPIFIAITFTSSPDYISQITSHPTGRLMMFVSIGLYIAGFVWVKRLVKPRH
jgi:tight adherence protein B